MRSSGRAANESAVRELGDETLKKIAVELVVSLRRSVTVDWAKRKTVRAKLRVMVRTRCADIATRPTDRKKRLPPCSHRRSRCRRNGSAEP
jgi:hypothetical protein